ncbi:phage integrase N-terminal SAM-like domain-containing protein [Mesorhizobium sp. WSM3864]|uniref:phage integrase N-terminal SAM-like domain-containing protein n=1 Tax=Mesorhizobium sp. WSM3864 TaxID=2029404 RepID=UPI001FE0263F|nr:phage integrase N-terminal SAM-like domain-containing protein [Mesorhizobium sp. WSM3864]
MTYPVLDAPISPLRQRLIDDMNMRRFIRETQRNYLREIGRLATFLGRSPDTATTDDLRRFKIEQQDDSVPVPTTNSIVSASLLPHSYGRSAPIWCVSPPAWLRDA